MSVIKYDLNKLNPYIQSGAIIILILLFNIGTKLVGAGGDGLFERDVFWVNWIAFTLVFAIFNSILSLIHQNQNKYWGQSLTAYTIMSLCGGGMAYLFSGLSMDEAGSYRWVFMVMTMVYLIIFAIARTMRKIVGIAEKQDNALRGDK